MTLSPPLAPPRPARPKPPTRRVVGPEDHGRRMSLKEFGPIEVREGHTYELSRGVIEVSDIPSIPHLRQFNLIRNAFVLHQAIAPDAIHMVLGGGEAKQIIPTTESERHPDVSIYFTPPPPGAQPWDDWAAEIVIEIVSPSSARRDYHEKAVDYWEAGAAEYLVFDARRAHRRVLVHRRGPDGWEVTTLGPGDVYTTALLPGLALPVGPVLDAGNGGE